MSTLTDPFPEHASAGVHGYGASGRAATKLLRVLGKKVVVADAHYNQTPPEIDGVRFQIGSHAIADVHAHVLSPSLNPEWPENQKKPELQALYQSVQQGSSTAISEIELALRAYAKPFIAIGGTDGKSTTAALTHAVGSAFGHQSVLGGNSWRALSDVVLENIDAPVDTVVVEISAFQLHRPHQIHPNVAILTNIAADHLDHYADFGAYVDAKLAMFAHQHAGDSAILCRGDAQAEKLAETLEARGVRVLWFGNQALGAGEGAGETDAALHFRVGDVAFDVPLDTITVLGPHNRRNVMASVLAWVALTGTAPGRDALHEALKAFHGLPHRVRYVGEVGGVAYYNDSKATNVHAACVGIASMTRPTIAIVGGVEKHLSLDALWTALAVRGRMVIAIGELQDRIAAEAPASLPVLRATSMEEAVKIAQEKADAGDAVLLAPTSSSFDMFRSFEARGDAFEAAVRALAE